MTTTKVQDLTNLGNAAVGDKLVGERVDGTTVRVNYAPTLSMDTSPTLAANITLNNFNITGTGAWQGSVIGVAYGGSGRATATAYAPVFGGTTGTGAHQSGTAGTSGQLLQSGGASAVAGWTTATYPTTASSSGNILYSDGTNWTSAAQTSITSLGTITTGTWQATVVGMTYGGSGANLTPSDGGIIYSNASTMAVLAGTATANKMLLSGSSTTPTWSTSTIPTSAGATANKILVSDGTNYILSTPTFPNASATAGKHIKSDGTNWIATTTTIPDTGTAGKVLRGDGTNYVESTSTFADTYAASTLLYSNGANTVTGLATANNGILVTNGSGVPSISSSLPTGVVATQANQETATSTVLAVTPGRQQYHPSAAKVWLLWNSVTSTTITASYNVTSLTDNGTGDTTVNFTTNFSTANYAVTGGGITVVGSTFSFLGVKDAAAYAVGSIRVMTAAFAGSASDFAVNNIACFGDQ